MARRRYAIYDAIDAVLFLAFVAFIVFAWYFSGRFPLTDEAVRRPLGSMAPVISGSLFVILYVVVTFFLWFSKDAFRLAGALVFGPWISTLLVWLAEMVNCWVLFHFARKMGKRYVEHMLPEKAQRIYARVGETGFGWLFLLRCAPVVAFRVLDLSAGLSSVSFGRYFYAACIGSPLRIFWLQLMLAGAGTAVLKGPAVLSEYLVRQPGFLVFSLLYFIFMIVALIIVKKRERVCR
jgi:uncharacterized membrane protein YdjX (TVP38/TMEM64 family)